MAFMLIPDEIHDDPRIDALSSVIFGEVYTRWKRGHPPATVATIAAKYQADVRTVRRRLAGILQQYARQNATGLLELVDVNRWQATTCGNPSESKPSPSPITPPSPPVTGGEEPPVEKKKEPPPPYQDVLREWNRVAAELGGAKAMTMNDERKKQLTARWKDPWWRDNWRQAVKSVGSLGDHYRGVNDSGWKANIEWFLRPKTVPSLIEGHVGAPTQKIEPTPNVPAKPQRRHPPLANCPGCKGGGMITRGVRTESCRCLTSNRSCRECGGCGMMFEGGKLVAWCDCRAEDSEGDL